MKLWDLVEHDNRIWVVHRYIDTKVAFLQSPDGQVTEVSFDADLHGNVRVIANPPSEWPYLMVRDNPRGRRITKVSRFRGIHRIDLLPFYEWSLSDPGRAGGALFLSPALRLQPSDTLLVSWAVGPDTSVKVPRQFGTIGSKVRHQEAKIQEPSTVYSRLLADTLEDEDS